MVTSARESDSVVWPRAFVQREEFLVERCAGRNVLHLGCIGETEGSRDERLSFFLGTDSLHTKISKRASNVVGIDIDSEIVESINACGRHDVYVGNVETLESGDALQKRRFDLIVAGDIIEHLSNPGLMLDRVGDFLSPNGELLITTPNAFGLANHLRYLLGRFREGSDHVQSYSFLNLSNLLTRHGFEIRESYSCYQEASARMMKLHWAPRLSFLIGKKLLARFPKLGGTILIIAVRGL